MNNNFADLSETSLHEVIGHLRNAEDYQVNIYTAEGPEHIVVVGSDENGIYEVITDEEPNRRLKTLQEIFNYLGIEQTDEYERVFISIDAYWQLY